MPEGVLPDTLVFSNATHNQRQERGQLPVRRTMPGLCRVVCTASIGRGDLKGTLNVKLDQNSLVHDPTFMKEIRVIEDGLRISC